MAGAQAADTASGRTDASHAHQTNASLNFRLCFTRYAQSSRATKPTDSSVSYASAILQVGSRP